MRAAVILAVACSIYANEAKWDAPGARKASRAAATASAAAARPAVGVLELEIDPRASRWNGHWTGPVAADSNAGVTRFVLDGPTLDAVRLLDGGGRPIEILWGSRGDGRTSIEPRANVAPGPQALQVSYSGTWATTDSGLVRSRDSTRVAWRHAAGRAVPALEAPARTAIGRLIVHVPARWRVRSGLSVVRFERQPGWTTTVFRGPRSGAVESLEFEIVPNRRR